MRNTRNQGIVSYSSAAAAALVAAVVSSTPALAQQPAQGATLMTTDVIVLDSAGAFMSGFVPEDSRVLADGVEREIVSLVLRRDAETSDYYMFTRRARSDSRSWGERSGDPRRQD